MRRFSITFFRLPLMSYPPTRRDEESGDVLHGTKVPDPYRWLEDSDSAETKAWVKQQSDFTEAYLASLPARNKLREVLKTSYDYEKIGCPTEVGGHYYIYYNTGVQHHSALYRFKGLDGFGSREVVLDPNELSEDGTTAIGCTGFSESGKYFAYGLAMKGTDWRQVFVKDLSTLCNTPDVLNWVKFSSITWTHDDLGFFYCRYTPPPGQTSMTEKTGAETDSNRNQKLCYHRLGTPEESDPVIVEDPVNDKWMFGAAVTDDGNYVVFTTHESCAPMNLVSIAPYAGDVASLKLTPVISKWEYEYSVLCNDGPVFYFMTNKDAPKKKIVKTTFVEGQTEYVFEDVLPEDPKRVLSFATVLHSTLLVVYMEDVVERLYVGALASPHLVEVPLPTVGAVAAMKCERYKDWFFIKLMSYTTPGLILHTTIPKDAVPGAVPRLTTWKEEKVGNMTSSDFTCRQMFYKNKDDDTRIPLFVLSPAGAENECLPTVLYGYGGFNISMTPSFSPFRLTFVQKFRAHYAVACIRGGDEYGEEWHINGAKEKKQNSLNDFQYAARFLQEIKMTEPTKLAILGGSNGGLLVAACCNQAPELFACVCPQVGVLDMFRFHKFTIGSAWISEFLDPDKKEEFEVIQKYSPLHNIRSDVRYPRVMCLTGDHDDRVVPLHTFKYIATLQHLNPPGGQYFARIEVSAGHGATTSTLTRIKETADLYAFIADSVGATYQGE